MENEYGNGGVPDGAYLNALKLVVETRVASIAYIQRRCSIGYALAGKIIEWMEDMGYITEFDGTPRVREVLITKEEFEAKYGGLD